MKPGRGSCKKRFDCVNALIYHLCTTPPERMRRRAFAPDGNFVPASSLVNGVIVVKIAK